MDAQTFSQEAMKHERLLYRISWAYLRRDEDCADAVQETLLKAWQQRHRLRSMEAFRAWLCRILVNTCKDMLKRRSRTDTLELTENITAAPADQEALELREAIDHLPPEQRMCVILHYLEGWSVAEVAQALGVPQGTVKTRLMYARGRMKGYLEEEKEAGA